MSPRRDKQFVPRLANNFLSAWLSAFCFAWSSPGLLSFNASSTLYLADDNILGWRKTICPPFCSMVLHQTTMIQNILIIFCYPTSLGAGERAREPICERSWARERRNQWQASKQVSGLSKQRSEWASKRASCPLLTSRLLKALSDSANLNFLPITHVPLDIRSEFFVLFFFACPCMFFPLLHLITQPSYTAEKTFVSEIGCVHSFANPGYISLFTVNGMKARLVRMLSLDQTNQRCAHSNCEREIKRCFYLRFIHSFLR